MVYKRYIEKDGKKYGPYYYSSERKDGKVVSSYVKKAKRVDKKKVFVWVFAFLFLIVIGFAIFNLPNLILTGNVISDISFGVGSTSGTVSQNWINVNITSSSNQGEHYTFVDFSRDVVLWLTMDNTNSTLGTLGAKIYDNSTYGNDGIAKGGAVQTAYGKWGKGYEVQGSDDYILVSDDNSLDLGSVGSFSAWVKADSFGTENVILDNMWGYDESGYQLLYRSADTSFDFTVSDGTTFKSMVNTGSVSMDTTPTNGTWYHVVGVSTGANGYLRLYVNGALDGEWNIDFTPSLDMDYDLRIGCSIINGAEWDGIIDDVLIFNRSLNEREVQALYNASVYNYYNNFTGLEDGTYNYASYAVDNGSIDSIFRSVTLESATPYEITDCGFHMDEADATYYLMNDIEATGTCLFVEAHNVTLEGQNHYVLSTNGVGYGINATNATGPGFNFTIRNCNITGFEVDVDASSLWEKEAPGDNNRGGHVWIINSIMNYTRSNGGGTITADVGGRGGFFSIVTSIINYVDINGGDNSGDGPGNGGDVYVYNSEIIELNSLFGEAMGSGIYSGNGGEVIINNSNVTTINNYGGPGVNVNAGSGGNAIIINNSNVTTINNYGGSIDPGFDVMDGGDGGDVNLSDSFIETINSYGGDGGFTDYGQTNYGGDGGNLTSYNSSFDSINLSGGSAYGIGGNAGNIILQVANDLNISNIYFDMIVGQNTTTSYGGEPGQPGQLTINYTTGFEDTDATYAGDFKLKIVNASSGVIDYGTNTITGASITSLADNVVIKHNFVEVKSDVESELNKSANITLYNTPNSEGARILKDGSTECNSGTTPACYNFTTLDAATVLFNVSSWTYYSIDGEASNPYEITDCGFHMDEADATYYLMNDIEATGTCLFVEAHNVTLEGQNHYVLSTNGVGYGINATNSTGPGFNFTLRDINITNFEVDVYGAGGNCGADVYGGGSRININNSNFDEIYMVGGQWPGAESSDIRGGFLYVNYSNITILNISGGGHGIVSGPGGYVEAAHSNLGSVYALAGKETDVATSSEGGNVVMNYSASSYIDVSGTYGGDVSAYNSNLEVLVANAVKSNMDDYAGDAGNIYLFNTSFTEISANGGDSSYTYYNPGDGGSVNIINLYLNISQTIINITKGECLGSCSSEGSPGQLTINYTTGFEDTGATYAGDFNLTVVNASAGAIDFMGNAITGASITSIADNIVITDNHVEVDSATESELNKPANITMYNTPNSEGARILKDGSTECNSGTTPACYNFTTLDAATVLFNVSSWTYYSIEEADTTPPTFTTIPSNASIVYGVYWGGVDFDATDETEFDSFFIDDNENFTINSTGYLNWTGQLAVGEYLVNVSINDTSGNVNSTIYNLNVTKATLTGSITGTTPITYGTTGDVEGSETNNGDSDVEYKLYRDGVEVSNPDAVVLGAGTYNYVYNSTGGQNYTANESIDTFELVVNQGSSACDVLFNETSPLTWNAQFKIFTNCDSDFTLYRNGTIISNNSEQDLAAGSYNFTVIRTDSVNYSNTNDEETFVIQQVSNTATLSITPSTSETYGTETMASCSVDYGTAQLYRDDASVSNPDIQTLAAGSYDYVCNVSGNVNYTTASDSDTLVIAKETGVVYTYLDNSRANTTIVKNNAIWLNSTLNTGTGNIKLYINGTLNSTDSEIGVYHNFTSAGLYNITSIYDGNTNYTADVETWWVNVTDSDSDAPVVILHSPSAGYDTTETSINFMFNVSDASAIANCTLYLNDIGYDNTSAISKVNTNTIARTGLAVASYTWYVNCTDVLGNEGKSSSRALTISAVIETPNTPGGGGGGGSCTNDVGCSSDNLNEVRCLSDKSGFETCKEVSSNCYQWRTTLCDEGLFCSKGECVGDDGEIVFEGDCVLHFENGWNFISICTKFQNYDFQNVLAGLNNFGNIKYIYEWQDESETSKPMFIGWNRDGTRQFTDFNPEKSYFVLWQGSTTDLELTNELFNDVSISLHSGWKAPAYPYEQSSEKIASGKFYGLDYRLIYKWDNNLFGNGGFLGNNLYGTKQFTQINPGQGLFILGDRGQLNYKAPDRKNE